MNWFLLLGDLGLERSAGADRGFWMLACIAMGLAAVTLFRAWRYLPAHDPKVAVSGAGRAEAVRILLGMAQFLLGIGAVAAVAWVVRPVAQPPAGWGLIQPPRECSVLAFHENLLWVGGREGLFVFDPRSRQPAATVQASLAAFDFRFCRALLSEDGTLWIGSRRGLTRLLAGKLESVRPPGVADLGPVGAIRRMRSGALWVGVQGGFWELEGSQWRFRGADEGLRLPSVDVLHESADGTVWAGSIEPESEGLFRRETGGWRCFGTSAGLPSPAINDLREDATGSLWVGTGFGLRGGAARWDGTRWIPERIDPLADQKIRSLYVDTTGRMWFCSEYDGTAFRTPAGPWRHLTIERGLPGSEVKAQLQTPEGTLWLATERGLGFMGNLP